MDFVNLNYFIETYENRSLTAASARLHISEQGLSKAIRALEREWDFPLFIRRKNRLSPTPFGDAFYVQAKHLMEEYEKSCHILEKAKAENSVLHIGFGSCVLPALNMEKLISEYEKSNPDIRIQLQSEADYSCEQMLENGKLDVIFCMEPSSGHDFCCQLVAEEIIYALLPKNHRLSKRSSLTMKDLADTPLISASSENKAYSHLLEDFRDIQIEPRVVFQSDDPLTHLKMVRNNMGIALIPAHWLPLFAGEEDVVSIEVSDIKKRKIYMAVEKARSQNPVIADFGRFIKSLNIETIG
ncbi:MAG: LysR family transcriptional regulator [Lachnospiraceae bacterium]|nr:LysR family transcriptional regulator [Lachnospiraceae bacterium]